MPTKKWVAWSDSRAVFNKCIGDDTKGTDCRSSNCIRKTKTKNVLWKAGICPITEILWKTASPCKISLKLGNRLLSYGQKRFLKWRPSATLNFRGPIMGSLKSPGGTSYRSSIDTIALNCLLFEKIAFLYTHFGDRQTYRRTDGQNQCVKALSLSRAAP